MRQNLIYIFFSKLVKRTSPKISIKIILECSTETPDYIFCEISETHTHALGNDWLIEYSKKKPTATTITVEYRQRWNVLLTTAWVIVVYNPKSVSYFLLWNSISREKQKCVLDFTFSYLKFNSIEDWHMHSFFFRFYFYSQINNQQMFFFFFFISWVKAKCYTHPIDYTWR